MSTATVRGRVASRLAALAIAALSLLAVPLQRAVAQGREGIRVGLRVGAFLPSDAVVRRAFGDVIPVLGVAAAPGPRPGMTQLYPSIELIGARSGRERFFVIPLTGVLEHHGHGSSAGRFVPYVRAEAGVAYFDYRIAPAANVIVRGRRGGAAGGAELGMIFTRWLRASARYRLFQQMDDLNFGGLEVGAVVGALKLF